MTKRRKDTDYLFLSARIRRQRRVSAELQHDGKHTQHARTHRHAWRDTLHQLRSVVAFFQFVVVGELQRAVGEDAQDAVAVHVDGVADDAQGKQDVQDIHARMPPN